MVPTHAIVARFLAAWQALDIPFKAMGASEPNMMFRSIIQRNVDVAHLHGTMLEQTQGKPCTLHKGSCGCSMQVCDLCIFGTPCPPFSCQRVKRYQSGSVVDHPLAEITFRDAREMILFGHRCVVMEQVAGFERPEEAGGGLTTPLKRPGLFSFWFCMPWLSSLAAGNSEVNVLNASCSLKSF